MAEAISGNWFNPLRITNAGVDLGQDSSWVSSFNTAVSCMDFTSTAGSAGSGNTSGVGSVAMNISSTGCVAGLHLNCFGVDRAATVTIVPPSSKRLAFTTNGWTPGGGLVSADAFCQSEAQSASLPGTYLALLATTSASAASRFNVAGPRWVRVDGVPLAASAMAMFGPALWDMVPNFNARQTQVFGNDGTWGGAPSTNVVGTSGSTCNNWNSTVGGGVGGRIGFSLVSSYLGFDGNVACNGSFGYGLTCLQQ